MKIEKVRGANIKNKAHRIYWKCIGVRFHSFASAITTPRPPPSPTPPPAMAYERWRPLFPRRRRPMASNKATAVGHHQNFPLLLSGAVPSYGTTAAVLLAAMAVTTASAAAKIVVAATVASTNLVTAIAKETLKTAEVIVSRWPAAEGDDMPRAAKGARLLGDTRAGRGGVLTQQQPPFFAQTKVRVTTIHRAAAGVAHPLLARASASICFHRRPRSHLRRWPRGVQEGLSGEK